MTRKYLTLSVLATTIALLFVPQVNAIAQNFTIQAGQEKTISLGLAVGDHVKMVFTVNGQEINTLDFYITDSHGDVAKDFGATGGENFVFTCSQEGEYKFHFSNDVSEGDKLVTLQYVVQHYFFGMEQSLFMTLIVAVLCVALVAGVVLMSKRL